MNFHVKFYSTLKFGKRLTIHRANLLAQWSHSSTPVTKASLSTRTASNSFQLLRSDKKAGRAEDIVFEDQVQDFRDWASSPRYQGIRRPYSAEDVVSKRGALQQIFPSSLMARKLFQLLQEKGQAGEPVHTSKPHAEASDRIHCADWDKWV